MGVTAGIVVRVASVRAPERVTQGKPLRQIARTMDEGMDLFIRWADG